MGPYLNLVTRTQLATPFETDTNYDTADKEEAHMLFLLSLAFPEAFSVLHIKAAIDESR